jgi:dihydrofolate synthase/folylpolyglutamate synthase
MARLRESVLTPDRLDRPLSDPLVARLFPPLPTGVHWGLDRTRQALAALGKPHESFRTIHVGGTNGQGSVTATVASVLRSAGSRAAAYTSPHLCSFRERVVVDGVPLSEQALLRYAEDVREAVVRFGLTFFEAVTVLAFHAFREEGVEVVAAEVGLGGRLDATNVVRPLVAGVTNVAMDHADFLGKTLAEIATEKAGIMKAGVPFLTAETDPQTLEIFLARGRELGAPVFVVPPEAVRRLVVERDRTAFTASTRAWGELEVVTPLVGRHHATNAALAIEILAHLPRELRPSADALLDGIRRVRHPGRDDVRVVDGTTWLFDVAHNTAGVGSLVDTLDRLELPEPLVVLIGVLGDKDWRSMLPPLVDRSEAAILTVPASAPAERRWDPWAAERALAVGPSGSRVRVVEDFTQAVGDARRRAGGGTVVVTGSVHTVGNTMSLLGIDPLG